jgi:hypothetical protein
MIIKQDIRPNKMIKNIDTLIENATEDTMGVKSVNTAVFARLLVEECAKLCEELKFTHDGPGEQAAYQRALCASALKEHYGLISKGPITALNIK